MAGLVVAGPWLTAASARLLTRLSGGASPLLAGRRLADNPKAAFRSVTGLVLPAAEAGVGSPAAAALGNVLRDDQLPGGTLHCPPAPRPATRASPSPAPAACTTRPWAQAWSSPCSSSS